MSEEVAVPEEAVEEEEDVEVEEEGLASWASFIHLQKIEAAIRALTPMPWRVMPDPEDEEKFYIAGPPETRVVMEGMNQEDAENIVYLINNLPEAIEHFEDLAQLWDALTSGEPDTWEKFDDYLEVIRRYQMHIAQLEGTAAVIPSVSTAADLTFMHIGSWLRVRTSGPENSLYQPIQMVSEVEDFIEVTLGGNGPTTVVMYLPKDMAVHVEIPDNQPLQIEEGSVEEAPEEEVAEVLLEEE